MVRRRQPRHRWCVPAAITNRTAGVPARSSDGQGGAPEVAHTVALLWRLRTGTSAVRTVGFLARTSGYRKGVPEIADLVAVLRRLRTGTSALRTAGVPARSASRGISYAFPRPSPTSTSKTNRARGGVHFPALPLTPQLNKHE